MKKFTVFDIISIIIILFNFLLGIYLAPNLPDRVPIHWNFKEKSTHMAAKRLLFGRCLFYSSIIYIAICCSILDPKRKTIKIL